MGEFGPRVPLLIPTGIDCSGAAALKIKYRKPNGVEGEWDADTINPATLANEPTKGVLRVVFPNASSLDQPGWWAINARIDFGSPTVTDRPLGQSGYFWVNPLFSRLPGA